MLLISRLTTRLSATSPLLLRVAVALLTLFAISPFFTTLRPPMQDLPQHLAAGRVLLDPSNPDFNFGDYFNAEWLRSQYLGIYVLVGVFYYPLQWLSSEPLLVANRLVVATLALTWSGSVEWLGARLLRRHGLGLFALVLFFNAHLILGFLNFLLGVALCFVTIALLATLRVAPANNQRRSRWQLLALGFASVACFYLHVVPFGIVLAVFCGLLGAEVLLPRILPQNLRPRCAVTSPLSHYLAFLPALLALIAWLFTPAGQSTRHAAQGGDQHVKALFPSAEANTAALDAWLMDVFRSPWDTRWMYLAVAVLVAYAVVEWVGFALTKRSGSADPEAIIAQDTVLIWLLRLAGPACAVAYYVLPASYDWIWPINARFPLLALMFLPFWLPRGTESQAPASWFIVTRRVIGASCMLLLVAAAGGETLLARDAFVGFTQEMDGLDEVLAEIPKGQRVATLVFDRGSRHIAFAPFLHVGAYYQAERGGVSYFSFNDFPQSPVRFLTDNRPPKSKPRWEWKPEDVRPDHDLQWFDYLLVRGGPKQLRSAGTFALQLEAGKFRLFKQKRGDAGATN